MYIVSISRFQRRMLLFVLVFTLLVVLTHADQEDLLEDVAWSSDGQKLLIAYRSSKVDVIDVATMQTTASVQLPGTFRNFAWHPTSNDIFAVSTTRPAEVKIYNASDGTEQVSFPIPRDAQSLAWSPDGTRLAAGSGLGAIGYEFAGIFIWDYDQQTMINRFDYDNAPGASITEIVWSSDNMTIAVAAEDRSVSFWNTSTGEQIKRYSELPNPINIDWTSNGEMLAIHNFVGQNIQVWNTQTDTLVFTIPSIQATELLWNSDDTRLGVAVHPNYFQTIDGRNGTILGTVTPVNGVNEFDWSPDGNRLATISYESSSITILDFPVANAGLDQIIPDLNNDGGENISLDATASSDADGSIVSYIWIKDDIEIATGSAPSVDLGVGVHNITLIVTDDDGAVDLDEVIVTID